MSRVLMWGRVGFGVVSLVIAAGSAGGDITPFTEEAVERGLVYQMAPYPHAYGAYGFGCGFADLDGDGDQDVILIGRADGRVGIFENEGTGTFVDHTMTSGIPVLPEGSAFAAADIDGDGDVDMYLTQIGLPNVLVSNDGSFTFTDVTRSAGVDDAGASKCANLGDYDGDGYVDIYVANYNGAVPGTDDLDNVLYRNLGDGSFESVGVALGVDDPGLGFMGVWFDYDLDGDVDLYLSNDRGHQTGLPNRLWRNDGGSFMDVSGSSGAGIGLFSMGVACGDFDGEGNPDLYCTNIPGGGGYDNPLLLSQGNGEFEESSQAAGVTNPFSSWGSIFFDCDNDGNLDLYVNNMFVANTLYLNTGFPCGEAAAAAGVQGNRGVSFSSAVADVDGDGDVDLLVNNLDNNVELFINHEGEQRNWARVRPIGIEPNGSAVGARAHLRAGSTWRMAEILAGGNSYIAQNELIAHFGLGAATAIGELIVIWPGGAPVRRFTDLPVNRTFIADPFLVADLDADGIVGVDDLLRLLGAWGACPDCPEDLDGDGMVAVDDLLIMLGMWSS